MLKDCVADLKYSTKMLDLVMGTTFLYGEEELTYRIALSISKGETQGVLSKATCQKIDQSAAYVETIANADLPVYGINTGFGPLCTTMISKAETAKLQENILMSHAVGVGKPISTSLAKLMMILKVHSLAKSYSGVQRKTIERIMWHIENDVVPVVPAQGSVGASGDLAPLAHLFLPLIGEGHLWVKERLRDSAEVLRDYNLEPLQLAPKEGLGLINGTQFIASHAVEVVDRMHKLIQCVTITGSMMIEGLLGSVKPFSEELHALRPFPANQQVASLVRKLLQNSQVVASHKNCTRVQDPYSLRCIPQVHGASLAACQHLEALLSIELNSVTDNPVVFNEHHTVSGGNFHGQPLAMALDYACVASAELGNISDRRIYLSLEGDTPGVPKLLMQETGTNSGFMIVQYTSAALVSENKGLCFPASADSVPTSLGQEDHVSMGSIAGRKALQVIENTEKIVGIELLCAAQALDFHRPLQSSEPMSKIHKYVRSKIPHLEKDQVLSPIIDTAIEVIQSHKLLPIATELIELN